MVNSTIYRSSGQVSQPQSGLSSLSASATFQCKAATTFGITNWGQLGRVPFNAFGDVIAIT